MKLLAIVAWIVAAVVAFPAYGFEVISIIPPGASDTDLIRVSIDSNPDCQQQALPPQRTGNSFVIQIVFDPNITNCAIANRRFTFDIGSLPRGVYRVRTVRMVNGVSGLVTEVEFTVTAIVPALSSSALVGLVLAMVLLSYAQMRRRRVHEG